MKYQLKDLLDISRLQSIPARFTEKLAGIGLKHKRETEAEQQLRENEERFLKSRYLLETLVEGTSDAVYIKDKQGRYLLFNTAASRFTGKSAGDVTGKDDTFLFPAEEARAVMEGDRAVMKSGKTMTYEEHVTTAEGRKATFLSTKGPIVDERGDVTGIFGIARDITDRRLAEESYQILFREMLDGFAQHEILCDAQGNPVDYRFLAVNPAFERLTGMKAENVVGKTVLEVLPGIERSWIDTYGRVALTGEPAFFENYAADLDKHYLVTAFRPAPNQFACIFVDISERKRAEENIRREISLRNVLLDNLPCIALVLKKRTREIVACNEIARSYGAIVGKTCHASVVLQGASCPFCMAPDLWETGTSKQIEVEYLGKFWHGIWVPFSDELYVHYVFDITNRKRAEMEMNRLQAQLQQSQKMEAVGRLAGGIAHDFNNLLTVITGYSEFLMDQLDRKSPQYKEVEEIKRAGERAAALTQQLLAFSRKQVLQPKVLDLNEVISQMEKMLRRLIGEDVELRTVLVTGLGNVKADPGKVEQVLVNLVVNARDAMPEGGKLTIETANVPLDEEFPWKHPSAVAGSHVCLTVSDTGTGMSEEAKAHLFEPFFTTKEKGKGTGLGLSTVYGIVNQSGGHITIDSKIGRGTTVRIYFPRVEEKVDTLPEIPEVDLFGRETLLLVEDEDSVRDIAVRVLAEKGYRVLFADDGNEGLRLFEEHKESIDLLITDVVMPGMGGRELATRVEAAKPGIMVLYMSGYTDDALGRHGVLDEGISLLQKPFTPDALLRKVREVLGTGRAN